MTKKRYCLTTEYVKITWIIAIT